MSPRRISYSETALQRLPAELLFDILRNLPAKDLMNARLISTQINTLISCHHHYLQRPTFAVGLYMENDTVFIAHNKLGSRTFVTAPFSEFDFSRWLHIEVAHLEIKDFVGETASQTQIATLATLVEMLQSTHNLKVEKVSLHSVRLGVEYASVIHNLFSKLLPNCTQLFVNDSDLPISISDEIQSGPSLVNHYRWLDSQTVPTDAHIANNSRILRRFAVEMKAMTSFQFHFEASGVDPEAVCDFMETWLHAEHAVYFGITLSECGSTWRAQFGDVCRRRGLTHNYWEFQSKTRACSHIKVAIDEAKNQCNIWPIFDVPARATGQLYCNARYFRDF